MKQALQQGFTSRSRWLLQILGLTLDSGFGIEQNVRPFNVFKKEGHTFIQSAHYDDSKYLP